MSLFRQRRKRPGELVADMAENNAAWCDAVCRTHGVTGEFARNAWTSPVRTPPLYPDGVTLRPEAVASDVLDRIDAQNPGCSVKDSFARLDLDSFGFSVLFDAWWVSRPPESAVATATLSIRSGWSAIRDEVDFASWVRGWAGPDHPKRLLRPELLEHPDVLVLAETVVKGVVAGSILMRTATCVGITNLFNRRGDIADALSMSVRVAIERFPGLPLVGYLDRRELGSVRPLGFEPIGPLRVWTRDRPS